MSDVQPFESANSARNWPRDGSEEPSSHSAVGSIDPRALGLVKAAYGVAEAISICSLGKTSLYRAIKEGRLRAFKNGKCTLFLAPDLAAFLMSMYSANRVKPKT